MHGVGVALSGNVEPRLDGIYTYKLAKLNWLQRGVDTGEG